MFPKKDLVEVLLDVRRDVKERRDPKERSEMESFIYYSKWDKSRKKLSWSYIIQVGTG